jgi:HSP20 family molecular chaperone IbpA
MERRMKDDIRKKAKEWERSIGNMREEFLKLYPADKEWGSQETLEDPFVYRRRGSTDVLDRRKMKTMFMEYPDSTGRRFKLRFDVSGFEPETVHVSTDNDRVSIRAKKKETQEDGTVEETSWCRKIERPSEVDPDKLKSFLTNDGILIVEAQMPPHSLNFRKHSHSSPSHSSLASSRSLSPSNSPHTPGSTTSSGGTASLKPNIPQFTGDPNDKRMNLLVEIGLVFKPKEITVQVIKDNCIQIKGKHEERTTERISKSKYNKQFELTESIEPYSLRAGLTEDGKLIIGALGLKHVDVVKNKKLAGKELAKELAESTSLCNVLDLAKFPPTAR